MAMAAIGVKLGQCGNSRIAAANRITEKTTINLGLIDLYLIYMSDYDNTKIIYLLD
jgi:hypothetical protein